MDPLPEFVVPGERRLALFDLLAAGAAFQVGHVGAPVPAPVLVPLLSARAARTAARLFAQVEPDRLVPVVAVPGQELTVPDSVVVAQGQLDGQVGVGV